ncbi:MAG: alpha/beta fold hydrolase, partial [Alphaproteobacteria bacterium]|nr:alpha/beta fold hydrolase [Alphaproteobacteria bacterium]
MSEAYLHELESARTPGQRLHLRERLPPGKTPKAVERAVICMHGATMAGGLFDLPVAGYSLLQRLAGAGFAAYALDARGYGRSGRPPEMAEPAADNPPFARAAEVIEDLAEAVDFVRGRTGLETLSLIGYSWGTVISGLFVTSYPGSVDRLVLAAPVHSGRNEPWLKVVTDPDDAERFNPALGAYRMVTEADTIKRWDAARSCRPIAANGANRPCSTPWWLISWPPTPRPANSIRRPCGCPTACCATSSRSSTNARSTRPPRSRCPPWSSA